MTKAPISTETVPCVVLTQQFGGLSIIYNEKTISKHNK